MPSRSTGTLPRAYPPSLIVYIPTKIALAIGRDPVRATQRIPLVTVSAVEYAPLVTLPAVHCLGYRLRDIQVVCHDLPPQSAVDGLLGLNVLTQLPPFRRFLETIHSYLIHP